MIKEYAVDPTYYSSKQEWLLIFQHFGLHNGRMISKFPKDWKQAAYKNLMENYKRKRIKEIERTALEEKLKDLDRHFIDKNRPYESNVIWYDNAIKEDQRIPFHAIISKINPNNNLRVLKSDQLDEENQYWCTSRQLIVERNFTIISSLLMSLFLLSNNIILVDPHFHPTKEKYQKSLKSLIKIIFSSGMNLSSIEYHLVGDPRETVSQFKNSCNNYVRPLIPAGKQLKFVRWSSQHASDPNAGGGRLHPRFILTNVGGVNIEWGLDEGNPGDLTTVTLLDPKTYKKFWELHHRESSTYTFLDEIIIS